MSDNLTLKEDSRKDPQTLEREIDQTRAEMNETLDRLEQKLTAGQLLDQCLKFFGKSGGEIGRSLGNSVQENPLPVLLTATGIAWMMFSPARNSSARSYDDAASDTGVGREAYSTTAEGFSKISEKMKSGATSARSQVASSKDAVQETLNRTTDAVKETVNNSANRLQAEVKRGREGLNSILEEQPLVLGAIGLAVGAVIGAALPSTDQEDRLMGEARDKAIARGKELGGTAYEKGGETVRQAVEGMQEIPR
jgi:ElaB/YqjD/DUF883 family membrane-anchored ribosome-binding protein